ncbi:diphosphomevalonate decarboxylase [Fructilactobacillus frigidiflavus]|uniref:diphosphomevalonate decarboxylase n=1 Tax=Fructilactobacillus frigidiflavus TaxID=3242688 RepID=UPI0037566AD4
MTISKTKITARAHTNIALIKYWGKANQKLKLPTTSSLSLTLNDFYTDTSVLFNEALTEDKIIFNGEQLPKEKAQRIVKFLDLVRDLAHINVYAEVSTINKVPTAAGLASSASGFAALAAAASKAIGLELSKRDLSRLARQGSGSATRSIYGGFVEWEKGTNDETSYAIPIEEHVDWPINVVAVMVNQSEKQMSSSKGMQISVKTSPYYAVWEKISVQALEKIKVAIKNRDFNEMGKIAEENAMQMHALTLSSSPDFTYFDADSLKVMNLVHSLRKNGLACYFTMDAGPNVKILVEKANTTKLVKELEKQFGSDKIVVTTPGPGIEYQ